MKHKEDGVNVNICGGLNDLKTLVQQQVPEEHAGGGQQQLVSTVGGLSHQDGAVAEVALLPQRPQLLHQLAAVVGQLHHVSVKRQDNPHPTVPASSGTDSRGDGSHV